MASNILSIGQSALAAAQVGMSTTGHNIANASTPGYNRQVVVQGTAMSQNFGFGFLGQGTEISTVKRIYNEYLGMQVQSAQTSKSGLDSYYAQIKQIDNLLSDPASGLSPVLQDFFGGIQQMATDPSSMPARQSVLSTAESLASRFHSLAGRMEEIGQGVNSQILSSVSVINTYAQQIAGLNDAIGRAQRATGQPPNDLLDQRDQLVLDLSKEIKATVVKQSDGDYNVFIGNGQPLVVGLKTSTLANVASPTDPGKIEVAYRASDGSLAIVGESGFVGGRLGGLIEFRSKTLEPAQNALGRIAIGLATTFNAQHQLGIDLKGAAGGAVFSLASPVATASSNNDPASTAVVAASISDPSALTTSDYRLNFDGSAYTLIRLPDGSPVPVADGDTVDGMTLSLTGSPVAGDTFLIRPTVNGASGFGVAITDPAGLAAAAPILTGAGSANTGSASISAGAVDSTYSALGSPVTLAYDQTGNVLNVSPATAVTVTAGGVSTVYAAGAPVPYTPGATLSFGGISFALSGAPADGDTFSVGPNTGGVGDNRNALLLGALQTANTLGNGTASFQGAYSQFVSQVGNKTRELDVTSNAAGKLLAEVTQSLQNESGVNLDEEATNLLRYQQAYQAAAKLMQIASEMFDMLLTIGR